MSADRDDSRISGLAAGLASPSAIARAIPRLESVFEPVRDRYGWRLALVFGNHAPGGICPYFTDERCFHCDIGAGEGAAFDLATNRGRLAWFQERYRPNLDSINHLVLYNSGSILNPREMPPEMLDEITAWARSLPALHVISLDSREPYIQAGALRRILAILGPGFTVRPILGIESADDRIRDEILRKGMPKTAIDRVFNDLIRLAAEFGSSRVGLDANILIAGPGTTADTAVDDAVMSAQYILEAGVAHGIKVDLNLHPYYVGSRGFARFPEQRRCSLTTTLSVAARISELVRSMATQAMIFIGWNDEGHDRELELRHPEIASARFIFDHFNQTNDLNGLS